MISKRLQSIFAYSINYAIANGHEYITQEHIFIYLLKEDTVSNILRQINIDVEYILKALKKYINKYTPKYPEHIKNKEPMETTKLTYTIEQMLLFVKVTDKKEATVEDMFVFILKDPTAYCTLLLKKEGLSEIQIQDHIKTNIKSSKKDKSILEQNSIELVHLALQGKIDPVIKRDEQIQRIIQILARRKKNNPILLGETGVGKTAIVEALALKIANDDVPDFLKKCKIYSVDMGSILAGTKYRGDFEKKLKSIIKDITKKKNAILFIDEIHNVIGAGSVSGSSMDASNILKPFLTNGKLKLIGATTYEEYRNDFSKDKAFSRRFAKVEIKEPSIEDTIEILEGLKDKYEQYHKVKYTNESLTLAVELSKKFIIDKFLPDSAIDVIDEVGAFAKLNKKSRIIKITPKDVENTIAKMVQIPPKTATSSDISLLRNLEKNLLKNIFGQDEAIKTLVKAIKISRSGMKSSNKPIGSFLFTGSTGVGKTEVAKALAHLLGIHFERFDMSEYSEAHTISRLIGAPAGYVGYDKGGLLSEAIKKHPYCVLLLDEIEKAHPDLMNLLLQIMDNAILTDNDGVKIDFQNVILIMTSNLGAKQTNIMGFQKDNSLNEDKAIKNFFAPEFRNRLDATIRFKPLDEQIILKIVTKFIKELEELLKDKNIKIQITQKAKKHLGKIGFDKLMGARPLQRVITQQIKTPLADEVLFGQLKNGGVVKIDLKDDQFTFKYSTNIQQPKTKQEEPKENENIKVI